MLTARPVYRSLNEKFTIAGYNAGEAAVCFFMGYYGMVFGGLKVGAGAALGGVLLMGYGKRRDPRFFEMLLKARRFGKFLDAIRCTEVLWYTKRP